MNKVEITHLKSFRRIELISLALSLYTLIVQWPRYHGMGSLLGTFSGSRLLQISPVMIVALLDIYLLAIRNRTLQVKFIRIVYQTVQALRRVPLLNWLVFVLLALVFPILVITRLDPDFDFVLPRIWIFGHLILVGSICLKAGLHREDDLGIVAITALIFALVERIAVYIPDISTQLTSMGWSEASRYYYASLFFAKSIYGSTAELSSLHPSRYLLQSIPFLIPHLPIWVHRAWQALLWLVLPFWGSFYIAQRVKVKSALILVIVTIWGFLFLNQGPVYYHLMICVIIVTAGFNSQKPIKSMLIVLFASIWAGISRINWFPVPGLLAVFLYLLEVPRAEKGFWRYWTWPAIWAISGVVTAFLAETAYISISGNPVENFSTSFTSSLLWYRLLPNVTYPEGVLYSILLVIIPAVFLISFKLGKTYRSIHRERLAAIFAILVVFFMGGIVVSVKIGGGSNLHNLDAFLVFVLISVVYLYYDQIKQETSLRKGWPQIPWMITALLILIPITFAIRADTELSIVDNRPLIQDIAQLQQIIDTTPIETGDILFISQRHFITFRYIHGVKLVTDYEKVFLMEMAMAGNQSYFNRFEQDLKQHRFALIVTEPLFKVIQDEDNVFYDESNAWNTRVTPLIQKYYHETVRLDNVWLSLLAPNP